MRALRLRYNFVLLWRERTATDSGGDGSGGETTDGATDGSREERPGAEGYRCAIAGGVAHRGCTRKTVEASDYQGLSVCAG